MAFAWLGQRYCNERYGFCVEIPAELSIVAEANSGDGITLTALQEPNVVVRVYASYEPIVLEVHKEGTAYLANMQKQEKADKSQSITYEAKKKNSYTVSGYDSEGNIFYRRYLLNTEKDTAYILSFVYPKSAAKLMDGVISGMVKSLKP